MKDPNKVKMGVNSRKKGKEFERKTKEFLESQGWIVIRWDKNVEFVPETEMLSPPYFKEICLSCKRTRVVYEKRGEMLKNIVPWKCRCGNIDFSYEECSKEKAIFLSGKLVTSKPKFNPFTRSVMTMSSGFPDFIAVRKEQIMGETGLETHFFPRLIECKTNDKLDKAEKEKCEWIEKNVNIPVFVASPLKSGRKTVIKMRRWNEVL